jgi:hypothetical protein
MAEQLARVTQDEIDLINIVHEELNVALVDA